MNLRSKFSRTLSEIKSLEGKYVDRCKASSEDPMDYHLLSFYSGMLGGFRFVWQILDEGYTEKEYDELERELFKTESVN